MKRTITISQKYLLFPVKIGAEAKKFFAYDGGERIYEFDIPSAECNGTYVHDFKGGLPVEKWIGKEITIEGDVSDAFADAITQAEQIPAGSCVKPLIHFAPDTGWMNDPCGLLYDNGMYHLYFQHNPFDTEWGNMSWGHAVSKDLLHWEQKDEALWPDGDGPIFTGSALKNDRELFGLPKEAQLYVYTSAGGFSEWSRDKLFVQKLAWSTDQGVTLNKMDEPILGHIVGDNRDMKVYWHEKTQKYTAVMYWENNDYAILNSPDMKNWEVTQKLTVPPAWECPDLMEVPAEDGGSKWVFWSADGYYLTGDFDGKKFTFEEEYKEAYHTMLPYAAQTFNGTDRVISIPWIRSDNQGKTYRSTMGLPRQFTLVKQENEYILRMKPVDEFEAAKQKMEELHLDPQGQAVYVQQEEAAVEVVMHLEKDASFTTDIYGTKIIYTNGVLRIEGIAPRSKGVKDAVRLGEKETVAGDSQECRILELKKVPEKIAFLSDGELLEVTIDDGLIADVHETLADQKSGEIKINTQGAVNVEIFTLK